jgi:cell wall-associated NlpC family hydrolase
VDRRFDPARPGVAGVVKRVIGALSPLRREPHHEAPLETEALYGESVTVYETTEEGWSWVQLQADKYVGWMPASDLIGAKDEPTHRVSVPRAFLFPAPDIKAPPLMALPFGARISVERTQQNFLIAENGFIPSVFLKEIGARDSDFVATARKFLGAPYLWGGKSSLGIDCSGLVQVSLQAAGIQCPRDSDMQAALGKPVAFDDLSKLQRGDLVCWKGHIGIVSAPGMLLHANAFHMQTVEEPLAEAVARIGKAGLDVIGVRRVQ